MKLLLAVDGSKSAERAVQALIQHAGRLRERPALDVVFVHLPVRPVGAVHGIAVSSEAVEQYYAQGAQEVLAGCKRALGEAGLAFESHLLVGDPAETIARFARERGSDMIFMGTRGMSTIGNLFLGSTANKVLHLAHVPVVLVPPEHAKQSVALGPSMRT
jgi:nucleotide-binding universal stress UspA family protein